MLPPTAGHLASPVAATNTVAAPRVTAPHPPGVIRPEVLALETDWIATLTSATLLGLLQRPTIR